ncbi:MAG: ribonuclease E/G, partial [Eubacteriales bacterium]|nr:ribonuclease E/G [Eubacteriales bacterium]
ANRAEQMETNFFKANIEAADELARQLRLRNLSGIIIVDFINMKKEEHNKELLSFLSKRLKLDTVAASVIDMTPLGLVEITRKRNGKTLAEQIQGELK